MKKIVGLLIVVAVTFAFVSGVYSQDENVDEGMEKVDNADFPMKAKMHKMKDMMNKGMRMITPEQLVAYDEEAKAAWREIEDLKFRNINGIFLSIGAAFAIGVAVLGGALAQGRVASSAMEGIARNPEASSKIFTPLIISLTLIESLVIYALVIAFLLQWKM